MSGLAACERCGTVREQRGSEEEGECFAISGITYGPGVVTDISWCRGRMVPLDAPKAEERPRCVPDGLGLLTNPMLLRCRNCGAMSVREVQPDAPQRISRETFQRMVDAFSGAGGAYDYPGGLRAALKAGGIEVEE